MRGWGRRSRLDMETVSTDQSDHLVSLLKAEIKIIVI